MNRHHGQERTDPRRARNLGGTAGMKGGLWEGLRLRPAKHFPTRGRSTSWQPEEDQRRMQPSDSCTGSCWPTRESLTSASRTRLRRGLSPRDKRSSRSSKRRGSWSGKRSDSACRSRNPHHGLSHMATRHEASRGRPRNGYLWARAWGTQTRRVAQGRSQGL